MTDSVRRITAMLYRYYITVLQAVSDFPLQPVFAGRYQDRFELVGDEWRWLERRVIADLYGDTSHHTRSPDRRA